MKKRKGMTLVEIVISMAIYGMIALLLAEIMTLVNATIRSTSQLNERLSYEAKYADNLLTTDDQGNDYTTSLVRVNYSIRYNYQDDDRTKTSRGNIDATTSDKQAYEYTANYRNDKPGIHYHDDVNYRFMTFDKVSAAPAHWPGDEFHLIIRLVPYFSGTYNGADATMRAQFKANMSDAEIAAAEANAVTNLKNTVAMRAAYNNVDGSRSTTKTNATIWSYTANAENAFAAGGPMHIDLPDLLVDNCEETLPASVQEVHDTISFEVDKKFNLNGMQTRLFAKNEVTYYMYVKLSPTDDSTITYYDKCMIEYNVNTGAFNPLTSLKMGESYS